MESETKSAQSVLETATIVIHRISRLCNMLSYLSDTPSSIPADSLCETMSMISDILEEQVNALVTIHLSAGKEVAA